MRRGVIWVAAAVASAAGCAHNIPASSQATAAPAPGAARDPMAGMGKPRVVTTNHEFTEGPLWLAEEGLLLFTEYRRELIYRLVPGGKPEVFVAGTGGTGAIALDPRDGTLVFSTGGAHKRVSRHGRDGRLIEVIQDDGVNPGFNPNDIIVHRSGTIFVTDPGAHTVYAIPPGQRMIKVGEMTRPNGVALSPDHATLYVADTVDNLLMQTSVAADGTTATLQVFARTAPAGTASQIVDGICIDEDGNVYATTVPGINVFRPDGSKVGRIEIPGAEKTSNCSFGGVDRRSLFVTSKQQVFEIPMPIPGLP